MSETKIKPPSDDKDKESSRIFDVARPGDTPAQATSRPVIVGHTKSIQQDPMVVDEVSGSENKSPKSEMKIEPQHPEEISPEAQFDAQKPSESSDRVAEDTEPSEVKSEESRSGSQEDQEDADSGAGVVDAIAGEAASKKEATKMAEQQAKKDEAIEKFIASKKYFVKTKAPPATRNKRWVLILLVLIILGGGIFMLLGPGKDMWSKNESKTSTTVVPATSNNTPATTQKQQTTALKDYVNQTHALSFKYPSDWTLEEGKDPDRKDIDRVVLKSPNLTIKVTPKSGAAVDSEVFLRTTIYVQPESYPGSELMTVCSTDDIVVNGKNLKLAFTSNGDTGSSIHAVELVDGNCKKDGDGYSIKSDLKLSKTAPSKEFMIVSEYVYTEDYIKKIGGTTSQDVGLAQLLGVSATKNDFKATTFYGQFIELLKSTQIQ